MGGVLFSNAIFQNLSITHHLVKCSVKLIISMFKNFLFINISVFYNTPLISTFSLIFLFYLLHSLVDFVSWENTPDSTENELNKNAYNETCEKTDLLNAEHEEVLKSNSNPSSEKTDFGSAGRDVAKSMMSLLLPQAVPLLRNVSMDKEFTISASHMLPSQVTFKDEQNKIGYSVDLPSSGTYNYLCFFF